MLTVLRRDPSISLTLCCFVVYFTRRFVLSLALCYFVLVFFSPFSIATCDCGTPWTFLLHVLLLFVSEFAGETT